MVLSIKRIGVQKGAYMNISPKVFQMPLLLVFLIIIGVPFSVNGQRDKVFNEPIVEGKSMLGIKLGDSESDLCRILGFPDLIKSNYGDTSPAKGRLKSLYYGVDGNNAFTIFTKEGKVEMILMSWSGKGIPAYKGKTAKGIGLGDSIKEVKKHYGECEMSKEICWYKKYGISLISFDDEKVVTFILISRPGELPDVEAYPAGF
jgi:hypothetical protein